MISVKNGEVLIKGSEVELLADLSCIIRALHENFTKVGGKERSRVEIMEVVDYGFLSDEEINKILMKELLEIFK